MKIAVFYHTLFFIKDHPLTNGVAITREQMDLMRASGLVDAASEIHIGINGGQESRVYALQNLPRKGSVYYHGLDKTSEMPTLERLQAWLPGHDDWNVLYFHAKGATHAQSDPDDVSRYGMGARAYCDFERRWRACMMRHCITNWRTCVADLDAGFESVGCHWMMNVGAHNRDNIWGGNFWWARASFLMSLPNISTLDTVNRPDLPDSKRYEAEHWIGEGPRLPKIKDYHINGIGSCP